MQMGVGFQLRLTLVTVVVGLCYALSKIGTSLHILLPFFQSCQQYPSMRTLNAKALPPSWMPQISWCISSTLDMWQAYGYTTTVVPRSISCIIHPPNCRICLLVPNSGPKLHLPNLKSGLILDLLSFLFVCQQATIFQVIVNCSHHCQPLLRISWLRRPVVMCFLLPLLSLHSPKQMPIYECICQSVVSSRYLFCGARGECFN